MQRRPAELRTIPELWKWRVPRGSQWIYFLYFDRFYLSCFILIFAKPLRRVTCEAMQRASEGFDTTKTQCGPRFPQGFVSIHNRPQLQRGHRTLQSSFEATSSFMFAIFSGWYMDAVNRRPETIGLYRKQTTSDLCQNGLGFAADQ